MLLTHAFALSASQLVHKKKSLRIYTSMHSGGLKLTKLTYTRLEDDLIHHRGDRLYIVARVSPAPQKANQEGVKTSKPFLFLFFKYQICGYQSLFPRSYRLLITIILQDHPGSSRQFLRCFLVVDPRACGCAHNPPRCVSTLTLTLTLTPPSENEKPAKGLPSHRYMERKY